MMTNYLMRSKNSNKLLVVAGVAAVAGVALVCALPKTRKLCGNWISKTFGQLNERISGQVNSANWERDLERAEKLKGPVQKRRNATEIKVASAGTDAWKEDWSSE